MQAGRGLGGLWRGFGGLRQTTPRVVSAGTSGRTSFATTFSADEDPISEGGNWAQAANAWSQIVTSGGNAVGSQGVGGNSGNDFNDSYSILQGDWGADYELDAVVFRSASISGANHEVELNVRFQDSTTTCRGYEVLLNKDGAIQCFRWGGAFNSFTPAAGFTPSGTASVGSVPNNARFKVRIVGDLVSVYYSADGSAPTLQCTFDITEAGAGSPKFTDGNPAIGQFCRPAADSSNAAHFGFQSITVTRL